MDQLGRLVDFACSLNVEAVPGEVRDAARYCVLDTVGSALGAVKYGEIPDLVTEFSRWASKEIGSAAAVWGQGSRADAFTALLLNGMMGHALELDDVHAESKSHVGAVVVATGWTVADALGLCGRDMLEAVIAGYEVMARIGMAMDVGSNRRRGWHATGLIGTFGAATTSARLLKLGSERMRSALGIAGTQSSGLWAFLAEGSTCKKLNPARAAVNGFTAAVLARGNMTGPKHVLDAQDGGLYPAVSDRWDMDVLCCDLGETYQIMRVDKKPYPCCRTTHHAIDAALFLRQSIESDVSKIRSVLVETYDVGVLQCGSDRYPESPVEAKFSIPFACAAAFVAGKVTEEEFGEEMMANPLSRHIVACTRVVADEMFTKRYPKRWGCRMTVHMADGTVLAKQIDDMSGSVAAPLSSKQEKDKFQSLAKTAFSSGKAASLMKEILRIDTLRNLPDLS